MPHKFHLYLIVFFFYKRGLILSKLPCYENVDAKRKKKLKHTKFSRRSEHVLTCFIAGSWPDFMKNFLSVFLKKNTIEKKFF